MRRQDRLPLLGSSPKQPIISPVQSKNALPLHPIMCPTPLGNNPLSPNADPELLSVAHPDGFHPWTRGLVALPGQPWKELGQDVHSSGACKLDPTCPCASGLFSVCGDGLLMSWWLCCDGPGSSWGRVFTELLLLPLLVPPLCVQMSFFSLHLTQSNKNRNLLRHLYLEVTHLCTGVT